MADSNERRPKDDQNFWNFWLLIFAAVTLILELWILAVYGKIPTSVTIFDFVLISLASFRLTRLFVYDSIMHFLRDIFLKRDVMYVDGQVRILRSKHPDGFLRAMSDLFSCPWCTGLQVAMIVVFFYYLSPLSWIVILMFAVGGVATFIQLMANMVGWKAENLKRSTESTYSDDSIKGGSGGTCG